MADTSEPASTEAQITFKVKSSSDKVHTMTMSESATVLELKQKLATAEYEDVAAERQRLIYSGRVMKNGDLLSVYKIKNLNTIHMVKSAASNPAPTPAATTASPQTPQAIPQNMAAGASANNLLAGLTGARFAGHANLPSRDLFGADGGMGAPPNEDQIADMLSNPAIAQTMNEALNNPAFVDQMIQSNPMLASMPNAREMIQSPYFRHMMTNPDAIRQASRMRRMWETPSFPAPGVTDTTPQGEGNNSAGNGAPQFPGFPGVPGGNPFGGGAGGGNPFAAMMGGNNPFGIPGFGVPPAATPAGQSATPSHGAPATNNQSSTTPSTGSQDAANTAAQQPNPFAALFGVPPAGGSGSPAAQNPFGLPPISPEALQQMMQMMGGMGGAGGMGSTASPPPPADTRPPEERYAEQLRQLNDMGFFDFDRNVAALRRSGGSVQGAIEDLLSG